MSRYFSRPRAWHQYEPDIWPKTPAPDLTVYDLEAVDTGLVDDEGTPIMRSNDRIGFIR